MRKNLMRWLGAAVLAAASTGYVSSRSGEPANLSAAKTAAVAYYDSGAYEREIAAVAVEAEKFLARRAVRATPGERLAIVYDIDETVLSNYPHIKSQDFGYVPAVWNAWVDRAAAPAITPMRDLVLRSLELGYTVFYITGRTEPTERAPTAHNLVREGLGDYERLIMKPEGAPGTAAVRKAEQRAAIEAEGYTIVASLGDQWSDLTGGAMERGFKLPNPFYEIP
jgi:acid phosphatase